MHDVTVATKFVVGEQVWVPSNRLTGDQPYALVAREVLGQQDRSVVVNDRDGESVAISSRLVHPKTLGFLVLRLGDFETETTLLDPLAKSVLQYLRLLIPDDAVHSLHARTREEIAAFMRVAGDGISHLILIGHGRADALKMFNGAWLPVKDFASLLEASSTRKTVVSLACSTGMTTFGRTLSKSDACKELVAPTRDAHGASASLFLQALLHTHLLHGHEFMTAARLADDVTEGSRFALWRDGVKR